MNIVLRTRRPWNKGILVGQKRPLQPKTVLSIRVRLEMSGAHRELALFNLAIDSKLRACDLVRLRVEDLWSGSSIRDRATNLRSPSRLKIPSPPGFLSFEAMVAAICFPVSEKHRSIYRQGSTLGSCINGLIPSGWKPAPTASTQCGERRRRKFTRRLAISGLSRFCLVTQNLKAQSYTSAWKLMTRSGSLGRSSFKANDHRQQPMVFLAPIAAVLQARFKVQPK